MKELVFEVTEEDDGGYCAECLTENIFTQGNSLDDVLKNIQEADRGYFFDQPQTARSLRLHLACDVVVVNA